MEQAGTGDAMALLAGGGIDHDFAEALPAQEEKRVADLAVGVVEALAACDFADVSSGDGYLFAAVELEKAFVSDFLFLFHKKTRAMDYWWFVIRDLCGTGPGKRFRRLGKGSASTSTRLKLWP